jgi:hypothetical protein
MSTDVSSKRTAKRGKTMKSKDPQKQAKPRKRAAPQLSEKTKKLTLKAFRLAYEQHHTKSPS